MREGSELREITQPRERLQRVREREREGESVNEMRGNLKKREIEEDRRGERFHEVRRRYEIGDKDGRARESGEGRRAKRE